MVQDSPAGIPANRAIPGMDAMAGYRQLLHMFLHMQLYLPGHGLPGTWLTARFS